MALTWKRTTAGAVLAIRDTLRDNLGTELTTRAALVAGSGISYTMPSSITSTDIKITRLIKRPPARECPQVHVRWTGRRLFNDADGYGQGHAAHSVEITWWLSSVVASSDDGLTAEEVLDLACLDWGEAIIACLKRFPTGTYAKDSGLSTIRETSFRLDEVYTDLTEDKTITARGTLVLTFHQETEYL